ncbi:MAG: transcription elongation factor GreA [bacterium]|nr:transcription elongation factor GreA [bacterium]
MNAPQLTRAAYERLQEEFAHLTGPANEEITAQIAAARALGDLSENGDYHAAREEKGKMQGRIQQIQALLDNAVVVSPGDGPSGLAAVGSLVDLRFDGDDGTERYLIGSIEERHEDYDVVSPSSPLGRAMIGARAGDVVHYKAPAGQVEVAVVAVETVEDRT